eukprot:491715_1
MGGTVGRCSSDEPTHARQMNQKSDLLNAKILSACEPHYNIYNQWKIIASGCNELLCDIQTRLTYKRDSLKLPKQINMWNKQTLKLEIIHHIERNGIISLKRIETLAEGVKNMKKKHFNEYVRDVAMSLPLISFTLPTTEHLFTDPSPQRYYIPKRCAFKEEAVGFYGENVWYMLLDLVIDITVSEKRKNRYLAMLYTHECNDLMCLNDRTGVIVLKNMMDNIESLISEFHAKYGVRKRDWLQYLIHEMHLARYLKSVQKANDDEDPQSGSSDDDVPIYVRRIPVIPIIPSETTSADDSSSNDYTSSETDRYEDTSDYSSSDYSSFESSE